MALPQVLHELGADTDALLAVEGWQCPDFEDPESVVSLQALGRVVRRAADATGCDHLGVRVGRRVTLSALGALGFLMQSSPPVWPMRCRPWASTCRCMIAPRW
jgi:hypothetical protein